MAEETKFGSHQGHVNEDHRSIGVPNKAEWQDLYAAIDARLTFPAQILASNPEDAVISIFQTEVTLADGRRIVMPPNKGELPQLLALATINPITNATTGSVDAIDWPVATASGQYVRMGLILLNSGSVRAVFNEPGGTLGGDGSVPFTEDDINIGYVDLISLGAGTFYKGASAVSSIVTMEDIVQFSGTQSLTTSATGAAVISPADGFRAIVFDEFLKDPSDEFSKIDENMTTGEYRNGGKLYQMSCDKTKTVTVSVATSGQNEVQEIAYSQAPSTGGYQLNIDGNLTAVIPYSATAADIEDAIEAFYDDVEVLATSSTTFTVTFKGVSAGQNIPLITVVNNTMGLTGDATDSTEIERWTYSYGDLYGDMSPGINAINYRIIQTGSVTLGDKKVTIGDGSVYSTLLYRFYPPSLTLQGWGFRFKLIPSFNGAFPTNAIIWSIDGSGGIGFRVRSQSGSLVMERTTGFGTTVTHTANAVYSGFVAGVATEFEINNNGSEDRVGLYVAGTRIAQFSQAPVGSFALSGVATGTWDLKFGSTTPVDFTDIQFCRTFFRNPASVTSYLGELPRTLNAFVGPGSSSQRARATFKNNALLDDNGASFAVTPSSSNAVIGSGFVTLTGGGVASNVTYAIPAGITVRQLTVEFQLTPNFSGTYPANETIFQAGDTAEFAVRIRANAGSLIIEVFQTGVVFSTLTFAHTFTSGVPQYWVISTGTGVFLFIDHVVKHGVGGLTVNDATGWNIAFTATNASYNISSLIIDKPPGFDTTSGYDGIFSRYNTSQPVRFVRTHNDGTSVTINPVSDGVATDVSYTLNSAPSFTLAENDIIWANSEWRRIIQVNSPTTGKLDAPFSAAVTAQPCMVSQAVYTKDLVNVAGNAAQKVRIRDFFPDARIEVCHVEYVDSRVADDNFGDFSEPANIVVAASNQGGQLATNFPLASSFAPPFVRSQLPDQELDYNLILDDPGVDDGERLFLVFFPNPNNIAVSTLANVLGFECSLIEKENFAASGIRDTAFAMSVVGTPNNSQAPDNSGVYTTWEIGWDSNLRANPEGTQGETLFFVDGFLLPRRKDGVTQDAYWEPVAGSNRAIMLNANVGATNLSLEAIRMHGSHDTSDENGMKLAALYDAIVGTASQVESGIATHSDLQVAYDYVWNSAAGGRILMLGDHAGDLTLSHSDISIEGRGRKSQITGNVTISGNHNMLEKVRVVGNLVLSGNRNFATNMYLAPAFTLTNSGTDNVMLIVQEP